MNSLSKRYEKIFDANLRLLSEENNQYVGLDILKLDGYKISLLMFCTIGCEHNLIQLLMPLTSGNGYWGSALQSLVV